MTVIKTYIAEDGTKFDNECECVEHEEKLRAREFADTAFLYDEDGEQLPLTAASYEDAYYIVVKTDDAAAFMANLLQDWGNPWDRYNEPQAGCWVFVNGEWEPAEIIFDIVRIIERIS